MWTILKAIWHSQRMLVYPSGFDAYPRIVDTPAEYSMPYEDVQLVTKDKVTLYCYLVRKDNLEKTRGTVILFHGNAMNHGDMLSRATKFFYQGFAVLTLEYRGYGHCKGVPSERGLCLDAQAAVDYVTSHRTLRDLPIIIYGQSLGGGVAIYATYKNINKVSALIIENTFTSIPDLVKGMPLIRHFSWLCTQKWRSLAKLSRLPTSLPILMLSGRSDEVIPYTHMDRLWAVAQTRGCSKNKKNPSNEEYQPPQKDLYKVFLYGSHNNTFLQLDYWETIFHFLETVLE
ncbi:Protein bem46 [Psilocybe cubensis]|uniref:Protein bem46 n=1 Tax=Psilocybe cubensis TaxID=181762 RepID=A0ACB8H011_PSICU|nr:Protein bem46 [Psilocybe cubensis]KAH9481080.1 Protein bem46 [Psilocybe cubensis]